MTAPQNFRSAFNGFNREDVVNHISYMTAKHDTQVRELKSEADTLRAEVEALRAAAQETAEDADQVARLEKDLEKNAGELLSTREELQAANQLLSEQEETIARLRAELAAAKETAAVRAVPAAPAEGSSHWDELKAYRRAETVERRARERVNEMYDAATAALAGVSAKLAQTTQQMNTLTEQVRVDLVALQDAIDEGCGSLGEAAETLNGLRPESEE